MDPSLLGQYRGLAQSAHDHPQDSVVSDLSRSVLFNILFSFSLVIGVKEKDLLTKEEVKDIPKTKEQQEAIAAKLEKLIAVIDTQKALLETKSEAERKAMIAPKVLADIMREYEEAQTKAKLEKKSLAHDSDFQNAQKRWSKRTQQELAQFLATQTSQTTNDLKENLNSTIATSQQGVAQSIYGNKDLEAVFTQVLPKNLSADEIEKTRLVIAQEIAQKTIETFSEANRVGASEQLARHLQEKFSDAIADYTGTRPLMADPTIFKNATNQIAKTHVDDAFAAMVARRNSQRIDHATLDQKHTAAIAAFFGEGDHSLGTFGEEMVAGLSKTAKAPLPQTTAFVQRLRATLQEQASQNAEFGQHPDDVGRLIINVALDPKSPPLGREEEIRTFANDFSRKHAPAVAKLSNLYQLNRLQKDFPFPPIFRSSASTLLFESQSLRETPFPWAQLAMPTQFQLASILRMPLNLGEAATLSTISLLYPNAQYAWLFSLLYYDPRVLSQVQKKLQGEYAALVKKDRELQKGTDPKASEQRFETRALMLKKQGALLVIDDALEVKKRTPLASSIKEYWRSSNVKELGDFSIQNPAYVQLVENLIESSAQNRIVEETRREVRERAREEKYGEQTRQHVAHLEHIRRAESKREGKEKTPQAPKRTAQDVKTTTDPMRGYLARFSSANFKAKWQRLFFGYEQHGPTRVMLRINRLTRENISSTIKNFQNRFTSMFRPAARNASVSGAKVLELGKGGFGKTAAPITSSMTRAFSGLLGTSGKSAGGILTGTSRLITGFLSGLVRGAAGAGARVAAGTATAAAGGVIAAGGWIPLLIIGLIILGFLMITAFSPPGIGFPGGPSLGTGSSGGVLDYTIPFRTTSITVTNPAASKQAILQEFPKAQLQYWDTIVNQSKTNGWNSAFVLALWIEETGASHHTKTAMGGGNSPPISNGHLGCAPWEDQIINDSLRCLFIGFSKYTNDQFELFMRAYSGEKSTTGPFTNNPDFPSRIKKYYELLVPGGTTPIKPPSGIAAGCPIPNGKIICGSYGKPESWGGFDGICRADDTGNGGHCNKIYIGKVGICIPLIQDNNLIRTAKSIDVQSPGGSKPNDPVYLPTIDGNVISWKYIDTISAGKDFGWMSLFQSETTAQGVWSLHLIHVNQNTAGLQKGSSYPSGTQAGTLFNLGSGSHIHITIGLNVADSTSNLQNYSPGWDFTDRDIHMCTN